MDFKVVEIPSDIIPDEFGDLDEDSNPCFSSLLLGKNKGINIGIENSWVTEDYSASPLTDYPIPLPAPNSVALSKFEVSNHPFSEDIETLVSPTNRNSDQEDLLDHNNEAGVCGLRNLGNTCFMSAGIQCLLATAPLVTSILNLPSAPPRLSLADTVRDLIKTVWSGEHRSFHPTKFKYSVSTQFPQFGDYRQHDCQEFLALLLDGLHEQLNLAKSKEESLLDSTQYFPTSSQKSLSSEDEEYVPEGYSVSNIATYVPTKINDHNSLNDLMDDFKTSDVQNNFKTSEAHNNFRKSNIKYTLASPTSFELNNAEECSSKKNKTYINSVYDKLLHYNPNISENIITTNNCLSNTTDSTKITSLEDIVKNAKTSNVNVMVSEEEANNEIRFDSEKYPRVDSLRRRTEGCSVNSFHLYENNIIGKRCKSTLTKYTSGINLKEGLDLKRVKLNSPSDELEDKNKRMESERQHKLSDDKNRRMESERKECIINELNTEDEPSSSGCTSNEVRWKRTSEPDADNHWEKHLSVNQSVIVDTFQGQFKSTVICSNCKFVSVTYEPFMYLSVPLPNTMKKKFCVTYVSESLKEPSQYLLEVNKYDNVGALKKQLLKIMDLTEPESVTVMAEVLDHHIAKLLDDNCLIRNINDSDRNIYAFKIINISESATSSKTEVIKGEDCLSDSRCTICLEDKHSNMKQHIGCTCVLCETCITAACQHFRGTYLECPLCRKEVDPDSEMIPIISDRQFTSRLVNISVVFRMDSTASGNNNEKGVKLFGHPRLLRVPNRVSAEVLLSDIQKIVPFKTPYRLLTVDGQGIRCSRCMFNMHCRGCDVPKDGQVSLFSSDTLAVAFSSPVVRIYGSSTTCSPSSPGLRMRQNTISLYDCISAFSQSERLDESNPWFCPKCSEHHCATKTLTVWRYPDYLIVYLKRFVFHNNLITKLDEKVEFPLNGLTLDVESVYDLYGVVCHVGGVTAGHYTAYTRHPYSGVWHYFNDCYVAKKTPQEEDLRNAYILFYQKQGVRVPPLDVES